MNKSKCFKYDYDEVEEQGKNAKTMVEDIMKDAEFAQLDEVIIGYWGEAWEEAAQDIIDGIVANKESFSHVKRLFIGNMDYEECEVSWIVQGNYEKLWDAMPQLDALTIKGSTDLSLGTIQHDNLTSLEIICGGLSAEVIRQIKTAKLPNLERLVIYLGVENYGFTGDSALIQELLAEMDFPKLTYLGIVDSEIENEVAQNVLESKYIKQITSLDLSMGTLTDEGGALLLEQIPAYPNVKELNLEYHFLSDSMMKKLAKMAQENGIEINLDDQQEQDEYDGEIYSYPMLTE